MNYTGVKADGKEVLRLGFDVLNTNNKAGKLKTKVIDGITYYHVNVGAFGCQNHSGINYHFTERVAALFAPGSAFHRRCQKNAQHGEMEHPEFKPGMTREAFAARLRMIRMDMASHLMREFTITEGTDEHGKACYVVSCWMTPSGAHFQATQRMLDNRECNIGFSLRSFSQFVNISGVYGKELRELVTYDLVNEGGKSVASKYNTPTLESIDGQALEDYLSRDIIITPENIDMLDDSSLEEIAGIESTVVCDTTMIKSTMGWEKLEIIKPNKPSLYWK